MSLYPGHILATLQRQGWSVTSQDRWQIMLSRPYPYGRQMRSWDLGVLGSSMMLLCVAYRCPPLGAAILGLTATIGAVWSTVSMRRWRNPHETMILYRYQDQWKMTKPRLVPGP